MTAALLKEYTTEAVDLLWEIKNLIEKLHADDFPFVHFESMLSDLDYRYYILFKAYKLHNTELTDMLQKLSRIPNFENLVLNNR